MTATGFSKRVLVTGSRDWTDRETIRRALLEHGPATVVHGAARGADNLAAVIARELGWPVEAHPADWLGRGRGAGPYRNAGMVKAGADVCLAFPLAGSVGTQDCMRRAERAGIPVINYGYGAAAPVEET